MERLQNFMIFDSHAHYDASAFSEDRERVLQEQFANGVGGIVNDSDRLTSAYTTLALAEQYPQIHAALGIHPESIGELDDAEAAILYDLLKQPGVVAVGEIGLDYYWNKENKEEQKRGFIRQLDMAKELDLPVVIHSRDAAEDTMRIMKAEYGSRPAYIHCYSYSEEMAREYTKMGYYIGIGGVLTFKNAAKLPLVVQNLPEKQILVETDCPYLAPVPFRGKRNQSSYLTYVLDAIDTLRGQDKGWAEAVTWENAHTFYRLK